MSSVSATEIVSVPNELSGSRRPVRRWSNTSTVTIDDARSVLCSLSQTGAVHDRECDSHIKVFVPERVQRLSDRGRRKLLDSVHRHNDERVRKPEQVSPRQAACA